MNGITRGGEVQRKVERARFINGYSKPTQNARRGKGDTEGDDNESCEKGKLGLS